MTYATDFTFLSFFFLQLKYGEQRKVCIIFRQIRKTYTGSDLFDKIALFIKYNMILCERPPL